VDNSASGGAAVADLIVDLCSHGSHKGMSMQRTLRMSTPARKRLMRDFKRLMQDPPAGISGAPQDNNILLWNAVIFGYDTEHLFSYFACYCIIT
jgi:hypothetical protein